MRKFNVVVTDELVVSKAFFADTLEEAKDQADADYNNMKVDVLVQNGYKDMSNKEYELGVELTREYMLDEIQDAYGNFWDATVALNKELNDWTPESVATIFGKGGTLREELMVLQSTLSKMQRKIEDYEKIKDIVA
ncbi:hypothetical protein G6W42_03005 [Campylobacter concisus]|uniref:hypothetical protein n=1 Tax=Campylobacter concisus TaxID=199 RepID=UPI0018848016|nr:hypothetical protein [Campylobacter concisus]MBE9851598.1 hypothetical protein [Campylobacter concisus]